MKLKVIIQATGRLGFTEETRKELDLSSNSFILIAQDDSTMELYHSVLDKPENRAFRVHKSGSYYYLTTKLLFDYLNVDYKKQTIIYDLTRCSEHDSEMGGKAY